ncbi:MAG: hypothetical protein LBM75_09365 [Myxococcales bacterium]|jgi:hypothetical protein|nr:hypothetical protein [Myxococcales bacterium]
MTSQDLNARLETLLARIDCFLDRHPAANAFAAPVIIVCVLGLLMCLDLAFDFTSLQARMDRAARIHARRMELCDCRQVRAAQRYGEASILLRLPDGRSVPANGSTGIAWVCPSSMEERP